MDGAQPSGTDLGSGAKHYGLDDNGSGAAGQVGLISVVVEDWVDDEQHSGMELSGGDGHDGLDGSNAAISQAGLSTVVGPRAVVGLHMTVGLGTASEAQGNRKKPSRAEFGGEGGHNRLDDCDGGTARQVVR